MNITQFLIITLICLTLLIDVVLWKLKGFEATFSRTLYTWSTRWPMLPFLLGFVAGHIFWSNCG